MQPVFYESGERIQEIQTTINNCLSTLNTNNVLTSNWDPILIYLCSSKQAQNSSKTQDSGNKVLSHFSSNKERTLLPTAVVPILHRGETFKVRALVDQGSQKSFITSRIQKLLGLPTEKTNYQILGMGGRIVQNSNKICSITICSRDLTTQIITQAIILPQLTHFLPSSKVVIENLEQFSSLALADPNYCSPGRIDMVIGSDILPQILLQGLETNVAGGLIAQNTIFGWILSGPITEQISTFATHIIETPDDSLNELLKKFWEQEEVQSTTPLTNEDTFC